MLTPYSMKFNAHKTTSTSETIVTKLAIIQFDQDGKLINHLYTPEFKLLPNGNFYALRTPHIVIKRPNEIAWQITANSAFIPTSGDNITFHKNVLVQQAGSIGMINNTINTEELIYYPKKHLAISNVAVIFKQPGNTVHAYGMYADLDIRNIRLLGKPYAIFEPFHA